MLFPIILYLLVLIITITMNNILKSNQIIIDVKIQIQIQIQIILLLIKPHSSYTTDTDYHSQTTYQHIKDENSANTLVSLQSNPTGNSSNRQSILTIIIVIAIKELFTIFNVCYDFQPYLQSMIFCNILKEDYLTYCLINLYAFISSLTQSIPNSATTSLITIILIIQDPHSRTIQYPRVIHHSHKTMKLFYLYTHGTFFIIFQAIFLLCTSFNARLFRGLKLTVRSTSSLFNSCMRIHEYQYFRKVPFFYILCMRLCFIKVQERGQKVFGFQIGDLAFISMLISYFSLQNQSMGYAIFYEAVSILNNHSFFATLIQFTFFNIFSKEEQPPYIYTSDKYTVTWQLYSYHSNSLSSTYFHFYHIFIPFYIFIISQSLDFLRNQEYLIFLVGTIHIPYRNEIGFSYKKCHCHTQDMQSVVMIT